MYTRLFVCLSLCFLSVPSFAQSETDGAKTPSDDFESHTVQRGTSEWFGKSKNKILDYATVATKYGVIKTRHLAGKEYKEDTMRYKLSVIVTTAGSATATVEANISDLSQYTETVTFFDVVLEEKTGIEGGSTHRLGSQKTLAATIVTSLNSGATWTLNMETEIDNENSTQHRQGSLSSNDRTIDIVDSRLPLRSTGPESGSGIEFIENGKRLGAIDDKAYLFSRDIDPELKLILAAAMETVGFRRMQ